MWLEIVENSNNFEGKQSLQQSLQQLQQQDNGWKLGEKHFANEWNYGKIVFYLCFQFVVFLRPFSLFSLNCKGKVQSAIVGKTSEENAENHIWWKKFWHFLTTISNCVINFPKSSTFPHLIFPPFTHTRLYLSLILFLLI